MNFPLYIAKRYLFSKSSNNAINIITSIAAIGIVVGAMALFIVLSGFSGLKDFSLQFTNVFDSDLKIEPESGKTIQFSAAAQRLLDQEQDIIAYSKVIEERIFLQFEGKNHIAYIKGVDENYGNVTVIDSILFLGRWFVEGQQEAVIGYNIAHKLSLGTMDFTSLPEILVPKPGTGQILVTDLASAFNKQDFIASGIYDVNEDVNGKYVFTDLPYARDLLQLDSTTVSSVALKLKPDVDEGNVREALTKIFSDQPIVIKNRIQQNDALYKMLNTENVAVYLIFTLVLIIALFNVIGSIIMMILDKRKNIKTLYNLGATIKEIRKVFFLQGALMTVLGGALGITLGVLVVWGQLQFKFIYITASLPYPVELKLINVVIVFVTLTVLGLLASKIAASRVRTQLLE
ncbi:MAG TPA: ABC transporter permease [Flavobacteriaceae bacterium]|nr:ABC transporter permease [Flavobacteriaceae bacterium]MAY52961.1 ABC transporter permease [Flavobacteriaceae bacterium]HBR53386.1 ABC transporter permease [Flavobacteriaceae bacterium]HIB47407.1 ABC transporter permease [Flavobacteriaceae bacterium]HIN99074.1 ABC transporter permease [Flavobacteriaceae bacterium]